MNLAKWPTSGNVVVTVTLKQGQSEIIRKAYAEFLAATKDARLSCRVEFENEGAEE